MITGDITPTLLLACGNPMRRDDGLGLLIAEEIEVAPDLDVDVEIDYQLNLEDALAMRDRQRVIFVDASRDAPPPLLWYEILPVHAHTFTSHVLTPPAILAIARDYFRATPEAWVLAVRGYDFEMGEGLSPEALRNAQSATAFLKQVLNAWQDAEALEGRRHA